MTAPGARASGEAPRTYFFLSYAHVPPLPDASGDRLGSNGDYWVKKFYHDLHAAVGQQAKKDTTLDIGFFDPQLPVGSDWKELLVEALGAAEVFVPLYSPRYLRRGSWPMNELASFRQRVASAGSHLADQHIQPVLWIPLPSRHTIPEYSRTFSLGEGIPEYAENGLRAMRMLKNFRDAYQEIVRRLAVRIVIAAEDAPLGRSSVPALTTVPVQDELGLPAEKPFLVAVLAPTQGDLPEGRLAAPYGERGVQWRPFTNGPTAPVAAYAVNVAERLGLPARAIDVDASEPMFDAAPGLLLIDPWIAATEPGKARLAAALALLRRWVAAVVVSDPSDPQYGERGAALAAEVLDMLPTTEPMRVKDARGADIFERLVPVLVTQTRRQYLLRANVFPPAGPKQKRPRLGDRKTPPAPGKDSS